MRLWLPRILEIVLASAILLYAAWCGVCCLNGEDMLGVAEKRDCYASVADFLKASSVDINTAGSAELDSLPGIGEKIAANIIEYREEHGPFSDVRELDNVNLIGEKRLSRILIYVYAGRTE